MAWDAVGPQKFGLVGFHGLDRSIMDFDYYVRKVTGRLVGLGSCVIGHADELENRHCRSLRTSDVPWSEERRTWFSEIFVLSVLA